MIRWKPCLPSSTERTRRGDASDADAAFVLHGRDTCVMDDHTGHLHNSGDDAGQVETMRRKPADPDDGAEVAWRTEDDAVFHDMDHEGLQVHRIHTQELHKVRVAAHWRLRVLQLASAHDRP